jgi:uncharacterized protein YneF (UPF0154 family)
LGTGLSGNNAMSIWLGAIIFTLGILTGLVCFLVGRIVQQFKIQTYFMQLIKNNPGNPARIVIHLRNHFKI